MASSEGGKARECHINGQQHGSSVKADYLSSKCNGHSSRMISDPTLLFLPKETKAIVALV